MEKLESTPVLESDFGSDASVSDCSPLLRRSIGPDYLVAQLITSIPLAIADILAIFLSGIVWSLLGLPLPSVQIFALIVGATLAGYGMAGLYPGIGLHSATELQRCSVVSGVVLIVLGVCLLFIRADSSSILFMCGAVAPTALICVPLFRSFARRLAASSDRWAQPVIIFGAGKQSAEIHRAMAADRMRGLRPLGFVDAIEAQWVDTDMHPNWYLGTSQEAIDIATRNGVYWAVVSNSVDNLPANQLAREMYASALPHRLYAPDAVPSSLNPSAQIRCVGRILLLYQRDMLALPGPMFMKRLLDLVISMMVAVVAFPLMLVIGVLVWLTSSGPIIYAHQRIGRNSKPFNTLKFRSMRTDAAQILERYLDEYPHLRAEWDAKHKLMKDPRVTPVGRLLRKSSLDELPQLLNVLKGEMSLVGPRPIVEGEVSRYNDAYDSYCHVRPGVAGLWQVSGRNNTTYEERVECDRFYVQNWSLWLDLYLLARTVRVVLTQDGAC